MKKLIQILFLALLSLNAFAQEVKDSIPKQKESKWSIQLMAGPTYTFPTFKSSYPSKNKGLIGYGFTAESIRKINKFLSINFGCSYQFLKYKTTTNYLTFTRTSYNSYSFFNTTLLLRLIMNKPSTLEINFDFGVSENYLINNNVHIFDPNNNINEKSFENGSFMTSLVLLPSISYKFNKNISLIFSMGFSLPIKPLTYEWRGGFVSGIRYGYIKYFMSNIGIQYHFQKVKK